VVTHWCIRQTNTHVYELYLDTCEHTNMKAGALEFIQGPSARVQFHSDIFREVYVEQDILEDSKRKIVLQSPDLMFYSIIICKI